MAILHSSTANRAAKFGDKTDEMMIGSMKNSVGPAQTDRADGSYLPNPNLRERGGKDRFVLEQSIYQPAMINPVLTIKIFVGKVLVLAALLSFQKNKITDPFF